VSTTGATTPVVDVCPQQVSSDCLGRSLPLPDYEQLYRAMQLETFDGIGEDRVRKKYACQGNDLDNLAPNKSFRTQIDSFSFGGGYYCIVE
jgi:hypothetical protein